MLSPGTAAPAFKLADSDMELVESSEFRGKRNVVLYFYDRDNLPGSTIEALEFSDLADAFARCNCEVLGVSPDDWMSHAEFRDRHGITVRLLADPECEVCGRYDVVKAGGSELTVCQRPHVLRSTFVIDRAGKLRHALYGVVSPKGHAKEVLKLVKSTLH
jgi:thioredoxin-dependent peroxiredoxin